MLTLTRLLGETSRTFAMAVPLLESPLRERVEVAYLLLRIADTFEDAERWPREKRRRALLNFSAMLLRPAELSASDLALVAGWVRDRPCDNAAYLELLSETPRVLGALADFGSFERSVISLHAVRTCDGMARVVSTGSASGRIELGSLTELRDYCYIVAGIVGELLTELFLHHAPQLEPARESLEREAARFGEGLQLVNILKDQRDDAREGRRYIPADVLIEDVFALARSDLAHAERYITALQGDGAPRGVLSFCALPVLLASEALEAVAQRGPGSKVPRARVMEIAAALERRLDAGGAAVGTQRAM